MNRAQVSITIEFNCDLTLDELFPNDDAPLMIDRDVVMTLLEAEGLYRVPLEWGFPTPKVYIGFRGYDEMGRPKHAERLWNNEKLKEQPAEIEGQTSLLGEA